MTLAAAPSADLPRRRSRSWAKFAGNRAALVGGAVVVLFVGLALLAPLVAPFDPLKTSFTAIRKAPSALEERVVKPPNVIDLHAKRRDVDFAEAHKARHDVDR